MTAGLSLRLRLIGVILGPLILTSLVIGAWAYLDAQRNAAERFDRSLLSTALAISRDTAVTGGDALSKETRDLLRDTSGGAVFYHVYAPDGVFVTGYATPPVPPTQIETGATQIYYDAIYQAAPVRALRFSQSMSVDGVSGLFTFTVWQNTALRDGFVRTRTVPVFVIITSMIGALAVIVWFGVSVGLAPLRDLEEAIARRSAGDLSPIRRAIPPEVSGIVGRLNALLQDLSRTLLAKDAFISDAAHQLRNPIAGVLSLAETLPQAATPRDAQERAADLHEAARDLARLADDLLTLERAKAGQPEQDRTRFAPLPILSQVAAAYRAKTTGGPALFHADLPAHMPDLKGDPVMFEQAILNLLDNALSHGGPALTQVALRAETANSLLKISVTDNGQGIDPGDFDRAMARFSQIEPREGTGLGLPICEAVVQSFGGAITLLNENGYFTVALSFPTEQTVENRVSS